MSAIIKFIISTLLSFTTLLCYAAPQPDDINESTQNNVWWQAGKSALQQRLQVKPNYNQAKNVILFIGDGMGISTVTAARIFDGQSRGHSGEENVLSFEHFPNIALIKTYSVDAQVADSASTASAMNTGIKTKFTALNTWEEQTKDDCFGPNKSFPQTLAEISELKGLSTGIVTTDKITGATPAAVYAHSPDRNWETDASIPKKYSLKGCVDIAQQLINFPYENGIDVIMGGGSEAFLPSTQNGKRTDNQDLISLWKKNNPSGEFIQSLGDFRNNNAKKTDKLFGIFASRQLSHASDRDVTKQPSLAEMTVKAIDVLSQNPNGYFLMIENGHIDRAHHQNNAFRALSDTQAFAQAIEQALDKVDLQETLILVTADHSHPFTMVGYPERGNPILGLVKPVGHKGGAKTINGFSVDKNNQPYTTLGYRVGPANKLNNHKLLEEHVLDNDFHQKTAIPTAVGFHGGEDVALYATGPHSYLVGGVLEQNVIFHIISQALGWNSYKETTKRL